jgi:UDP-N-acetylmuramate-alanine ligase
MASADLLPSDTIERRILVVRGHKVILDADLAALYGVLTGRLNEQVKRNAARFPADFVFRLTADEAAGLISQIATSNGGRGGRRKLPYVFTEHGALMAASVLNTPRAVEVSVYVVRAFVRLREALATHRDLARRLDEIEGKVAALATVPDELADHGQAIEAILEALRQLMASPSKSTARPLGFRPDPDVE